MYRLNTGGAGTIPVKATPLQINGVLYFTVPDHTWAVDARTGRELWHYVWQSKGGTHISCGLSKALDILEGFQQYDKYLFFFSDGDNSSSDDEAAKSQLERVVERYDLCCYGRINPCDSPISPFNKLVKEKLEKTTNLAFSDIKDLENVQETIRIFLNLINR